MTTRPFCCNSAIPSTIRYLSHLIPKQITHIPLSKNRSSIPLITSFLVHLSTNAQPVEKIIPDGYSSRFHAIIQVKQSDLLDKASQGAGAGTSNRAHSPAPSSTPSISIPSNSSHHTPVPRNESALQTTSALSPERYFVPLEKAVAKTSSPTATALEPSSNVFNHRYREIETWEAMESLRFPGGGIEIGDGEEWELLDGVERLWCHGHGVGFELRVWVRE